jgi:predicted RNA binding protein YcfA (HicA-like mRNA interferase family)
MKYREAAKKLKRMGCQEIPRRGGGSHRKWYNPSNGRIAPVPDWGSKDLKMGTLRHIIRQLGLDWETFKQAK